MEQENLTPEQQLCRQIKEQFSALQAARKQTERGWELNVRFYHGDQYCRLSESGEMEESAKNFDWEQRRVFNHIAAVVDTRVSKLSRIRPALSVRAASDSEEDRGAAALASAILSAAQDDCDFDGVISAATMWSELCGTAFYKIVWNSAGGRQVGFTDGGEKLTEGCPQIEAVSPFEIYPFSDGEEKIANQPGIIQARILPVQTIYDVYGVKVAGKKIGQFTLPTPVKLPASDAETCYELVIERYLACGVDLPDGRLTITAGDNLLYDGPLPYLNGTDGKRQFPFVKQVSMPAAGKFFGESVVSRLIPVQRAYNAVKNRKHEFLNRISMGCVAVEDGSVDIDELTEDGLAPGKVIVYRRGGTAPEMLTLGSVPEEFWKEEESLSEEFSKISGTRDFSRGYEGFSGITSATGLQLIIEQDDARLNVAYQSLRRAVREAGKQILRLYRQFSSDMRLLRYAGEDGKTKTMFFRGGDISGDDVVLDSDAELNMTPAQRRAVIFELMDRGLFSDRTGKIGQQAKKKILSLLGYPAFADLMPAGEGEEE